MKYNNEVIMEVDAAYYKNPNTLYTESFCIVPNPDCLTFTMKDSLGDGSTEEDAFKVFLDDENLYASGIEFIGSLGELIKNIGDGCVNNPVASPTTEAPTRPTPSPVTPTPQPTTSNCPPGESMFRADVFTDNNGDKIKIVVKKKNQKNKWRGKVFFKDGLQSNVLNTVDSCLSNDNCYRVVISDRDKDGLCCEAGQGYYSVRWKGEEIKNALYQNGWRKSTKFNCP